MNLGDLLSAGEAVEVTELAFDTRKVVPGTLFFCVPGFTRDGHDFAPEAIERGAVALVVERELGLGVPEVVVEDARVAMATAAKRFYGDPSSELAVVGVTGTNGKTTTCFLLQGLLEACGRQTGLLGTVKSIIGGDHRPAVRTTPEAIDVQRTMREMITGGDVACAMEVSSHALELHRADGIAFRIGLFTNLTQDHLDFHDSMDEYFAAKRRLFEMDLGTRITNIDDPYGRRLAAEFKDAITFAIDADADYTATNLVGDVEGSNFTLCSPDGDFDLRIAMPGRFNVLNLLGAWAAARILGVPALQLAEAVASLDQVPGRLQPLDSDEEFAVFVDYAHTPDSLANVLHAVRELARERVIVVFGCGGERDRGKRPLMGKIASELADMAIVTSDNPRSEPPEAIIADILSGTTKPVLSEVDRREAITKAIAKAQSGDVLVIAGKGHERGQESVDGATKPFDDVAVALQALQALKTKS